MPKIQIPETLPRWLRYSAAVFASLAGSGISLLLVQNGLRLHSSLMLTAVVIIAWFGGLGPGLVTLLLTIPAELFLRDPVNHWQIDGKAGWTGFGIYVANSLIICFLFQKRYMQRARTAVSPVTVTGGWMWKLDPADGGTVETHSPAFPHLSATRTLTMWLETVHPGDRAILQRQIQHAIVQGDLTAKFHVLRDDGEVRLVSMFGVRVQDKGHDYLVATCLEIGSHENPENMEWRTLPLG